MSSSPVERAWKREGSVTCMGDPSPWKKPPRVSEVRVVDDVERSVWIIGDTK